MYIDSHMQFDLVILCVSMAVARDPFDFHFPAERRAQEPKPETGEDESHIVRPRTGWVLPFSVGTLHGRRSCLHRSLQC